MNTLFFISFLVLVFVLPNESKVFLVDTNNAVQVVDQYVNISVVQKQVNSCNNVTNATCQRSSTKLPTSNTNPPSSSNTNLPSSSTSTASSPTTQAQHSSSSTSNKTPSSTSSTGPTSSSTSRAGTTPSTTSSTGPTSSTTSRTGPTASTTSSSSRTSSSTSHSSPSGCGIPIIQPNLPGIRIIGGTDAVPNSYPWIGRIFYDNLDGTGFSCASSLLPSSSSTESDLVVTAAHCVLSETQQPLVPKQFTFFFGDDRTDVTEASEVKVSAIKVIHNPNYNPTTHQNDIAVVRLASPLQYNNFIQPVCLPLLNEAPKDPKKCALAGWGRISNTNDTTAIKLQQANLPILDDATCGSSTVWGTIFDKNSMLCAGSLDGTTNSCNGDSGGPLACLEDGHYTLYGVVSFGNKGACAVPNRPGVYARVSALRTFIDDAITQINT